MRRTAKATVAEMLGVFCSQGSTKKTFFFLNWVNRKRYESQTVLKYAKFFDPSDEAPRNKIVLMGEKKFCRRSV